MKIFLAADHAGFALKDKIKDILTKQGQPVIDVTPIYKEGDDYPLVAQALAKQILKRATRDGRSPTTLRGTGDVGRATKGLLLCGSGIGVCIAVNRHKGIRAAVGHSAEEIKLAREHNDINVLCLSGRNKHNEKDLLKIIKTFLNTKKSSAKRHIRRIKQLG